MDTWYMAAGLVFVIIGMLIVAVRDRLKVKRAVEAKMKKKEASKAKRSATKARKVGLALTPEQQARAEGMMNTNVQPFGNRGANEAPTYRGEL